jgi:hypothetical protein
MGVSAMLADTFPGPKSNAAVTLCSQQCHSMMCNGRVSLSSKAESRAVIIRDWGCCHGTGAVLGRSF